MVFGRLTTKWRIFQRNLDLSLEKNSLICEIAAKLHNYFIDNDNIVLGETKAMKDLGIDVIEGGPVYNKKVIFQLYLQKIKTKAFVNSDDRTLLMNWCQER